MMHGFHHSVAVRPFRSYRCRCSLQVRTEMLETSFRMHRDEVTRTLIDSTNGRTAKTTEQHRVVKSHSEPGKPFSQGPITTSFRLKHPVIFRQLEDRGLQPGGCVMHGRLTDVYRYIGKASHNN